MERYKLYELCLNREYKNDKITPLLPCLYDITMRFEKEAQARGTPKKEEWHYYANQKTLTTELIEVFEELMDKYDPRDVERTIDMLTGMQIDPYDYPVYLSVFYLRHSIGECEKGKVGYYHVFDSLCYKSTICGYKYLPVIEACGTNVSKMLAMHVEFFISVCANTKEDGRKRWFFSKYIPKIEAYCHTLGYDLETIRNVLTALIDNYDDLIAHFELNGGSNYNFALLSVDDEELLIKSAIDRFYKREKRVIS